MKKEILEWVKTIVLSVVIALVITTFVKPTIVRQHSMMPTLNEYDFLIINRLLYKQQNSPKQRDIVVFKSNLRTDIGRKKLLIKRVIAVPGDTLLINDGYVYINGQVFVEDYVAEGYTEGKDYEDINVVIPEGMVFTMGDNRFNSMDSRDEIIGLVRIDDIVGKAFVRLYPFNKIGLLK